MQYFLSPCTVIFLSTHSSFQERPYLKSKSRNNTWMITPCKSLNSLVLKSKFFNLHEVLFKQKVPQHTPSKRKIHSKKFWSLIHTEVFAAPWFSEQSIISNINFKQMIHSQATLCHVSFRMISLKDKIWSVEKGDEVGTYL